MVLSGWTALRVVMLWPDDRINAAPTRLVERPAQPQSPLFDQRSALIMSTIVKTGPAGTGPQRVSQQTAPPTLQNQYRHAPIRAPMRAALISTGVTDVADASNIIRTSDRLLVSSPPGIPAGERMQRFSGSLWALMRSESGGALAQGGQLGGSQAGMRIFYAPGAGRLAVTARMSTALSRKTGREAALGIALRGRNFGLIAEQRFALDKGSRNAPAIFAYGGIADVAIAKGVVIDGYLQGGAVGIARPALFIDGAIRAEHVFVKSAHASLSAGVGAWGGAQPGIRRIDIGPQVVARMALADTQLRVSAEWRQRIAGNAAPRSGPSVTVGLDF